MASDEQAERTEPATPKRRDEARRRGEVAQSRELQSVVLLAAAVLIVGSSLGFRLVAILAALADDAWGGAFARPQRLADFHSVLIHQFAAAAAGLLPILLLLAAAGAAACVVQTGPLFSLEGLQPRGSRLDPISGMRRFFDPDRLFDLAKSLFKVVVVAALTWGVLAPALPALVGLASVRIDEGLALVGLLGRRVAWLCLAFLAVMAALDLVYQRMRFEKRLRMSRKEVRDEFREQEGNPQVRSRARSMQRELSRSRMIAAVADASVVVTNPTHFAVALEYSRDLGAPRVLAKGRNQVARRIREAALQHGIPIVENPPLARLLHKTAPLGREIPHALFQAVAEVLAYVYRLDPTRARRWESGT